MSSNKPLFEQPEMWLSTYTQRQCAYEKLVDTHRSRLKQFASEREEALQKLQTAFSDEIKESAELLSEVAPIFATDIEGIPSRRAAYSDRMAALLAKIAMLAYINFEDSDKKKILEGTLTHGRVKLVATLANLDTEAMVAETDNFVVVAFRGTTSRSDRRTDVRLFSQPVLVEGHPKKVRVHRGFYAAFQNIETPLRELLMAQEAKPIYLTGHSLGGALALVASAAFSGSDRLGDRIAAVYTFGSPRVGRPDFPDVVKAPHYRVVNSGDAVPLVPPNWLTGYAHTGTPILLKKNKNRPIRRSPWGSAFVLSLRSILLWPFARRLLLMRAHDISVYAARLDRIARYRGSWT